MSIIFNSLSDPELIDALNGGSVGVLPTDTVYGLVCGAGDEAAVARLYKLKDRDKKPGTIIAASSDQLVELGIKARYLKAVEQYWPNPLSIEIPHGISYLSQTTGRQAFRVVKDSELRILLEETGPLLTSSANYPGEQPANTVKHAQDYFGNDIDLYVDGGDLSDRKSSTLIRIVDDTVEVLREGAVTINKKGEIVS